MKFVFKLIAWGLGASLLSPAAWSQTSPSPDPHAQHQAKPLAQIPFTENTWGELLQHGPRPAAYLFTTSYCSSCPQVFDVLAKHAQGHRPRVNLAAVMMDVSGPPAQRHAAHFVGLQRFYVFDGFMPTLRQTVDPDWPDITPYVVLVDAHGQVQKTLGEPSPAMLESWLR